MGYDGKIGIGSRAVHVPFMREQVGSAPPQLYTAGSLLFLCIVHQCGKPLFVFGYVVTVMHHIYVVEAIVRHAYFCEKLKCRIHLVFGALDDIAVFIPGEEQGRSAEWIAAIPIE